MSTRLRYNLVSSVSVRACVFAMVACLIAVSTSHAVTIIIYEEDFSSAPTIRVSDNANSNYGGTGDEVTANHINQNQWMRRNGSIAHDAGDENLDFTLSDNVYTLIDLSTVLDDYKAVTNFNISFDVIAISGPINIFAYAGGGLDYNGTDNGYIFFRVYGNPPLMQYRQGSAGTQVVNGTNTSITATGTFETPSFTLNDLESPGDYVFIGFVNGGESMTIDNLRINALDVPPSGALFIVK